MYGSILKHNNSMEIIDIKISQIIYRKNGRVQSSNRVLIKDKNYTHINNTLNSSNEKQYNIEIQSKGLKCISCCLINFL